MSKLLVKKGLVSVVLLTQNRQQAVTLCLNSLYEQDYPWLEIIVIDNGSRAGVKDFLRHQGQKIKLVENGVNTGACLARNQGFTKASGEFILFMDSDVVLPEKDTIATAVQEINQYPDLGELGGMGFNDKALTSIQHSCLKFDKSFALRQDLVKQDLKKTDFGVDFVQSDFALMRRQAFEQSGGFDPFYFYWPEDADLSFQVKKAGYKIAVSPRIRFWHRTLCRRWNIDHSYFFKKAYLVGKNFSMARCLIYYVYFLRTGFQRIIKSRGLKAWVFCGWYLATLPFFLWLLICWPWLIWRRQRNFIYDQAEGASVKWLYGLSRLEEKLLALLNRILFWLKMKRGKKALYLFVTNRCTCSCLHCFLGESVNASGTQKQELSVNEIKKTYYSLKNKIGGVNITGGEPFLRQDIVEICRIFQDAKGLALNTNGSLPDLIFAKLKQILLNKPEKQKILVTVSLDGLQAKHDYIRQRPGVFNQAVKTIRLLKTLQKDYHNLEVKAQITLMALNLSDFYDLFDWVVNDLKVGFSFNWFRDGAVYGVDQRLIFPILPFASRDQRLKLPSQEQCELIAEFLAEQQWQKLGSNLVNKYTLDIWQNKKFLFPCVAPQLSLVLYANGEVCFCEMVKPFYNVREFNYDLKKVLKASKWKQAVKAVQKCFCIHPCLLATSLQAKHFLDCKLENLRSFKS